MFFSLVFFFSFHAQIIPGMPESICFSVSPPLHFLEGAEENNLQVSLWTPSQPRLGAYVRVGDHFPKSRQNVKIHFYWWNFWWDAKGCARIFAFSHTQGNAGSCAETGRCASDLPRVKMSGLIAGDIDFHLKQSRKKFCQFTEQTHCSGFLLLPQLITTS